MRSEPNVADSSLVRAGAPSAGARRAAVLVHGRDQDETLMLDVIARLDLPDVAYLLPVAPGRSWYDGRYFDPRITLEPQLSRALATVEQALAAAVAAGIPTERVVLGGFSQGACLVAELIAQRPRPLAGLAILTGALIGGPGELAGPKGLDELAVYASCAVDDAWIPLEDARACADAFAAGGAEVVFEPLDDIEHHVSDRAVAGLRSLLTRS